MINIIFSFLIATWNCVPKYSGIVTDVKYQRNHVIKIVTDKEYIYFIRPEDNLEIAEGDTIQECWQEYSKRYLVIHEKMYKTLDSHFEIR